MLHILSSIVLLLVIAGIVSRRNRRRHLALMVAAFVVDLGLVIYIEVTRHAVETVLGQTKALIYLHALVSTLVLVAYIAQITLGWRMLAGTGASRQAHVVVGVTFCSLRLLNYVTSFMI